MNKAIYLHRGTCFHCKGTGSADSVGTHPWGEAIEIPCDCVPTLAVAGPYQVDEWKDGQVVIQAHHGDEDVALIVSGNFATKEDKLTYAKGLCHELCQITRAYAKDLADERLHVKVEGPISGFDGEYRWLSNFWPSPIMIAGITYPTAEHAYQAMKTADRQLRLMISKLPTPNNAKSVGRNLTLRQEWDTGRNIRLDAMRLVIKKKFQNPDLANKLLATRDRLLYETNTWGDKYWGRVFNKLTAKFIGENHLGRILMDRRTKLRRYEKEEE